MWYNYFIPKVFLHSLERERREKKGKKLCTLIFALVLLLTCLVVPAYADDSEDNQENIETAAENENPIIDWTCYDYDELILIREGLDDYIHELERQYAIENGNRVITLAHRLIKGQLCLFTAGFSRSRKVTLARFCM